MQTGLRAWPGSRVGTLVFLVGSFLYVWLRVEPRLEYHVQGPYFFRHWVFLQTFLIGPGGLANYAGVFLAQLNYLNWLGALVFVLSQWVVLLATVAWLTRISGRVPGWVALIPLFVLLLLRDHYGCPVSAMSVGLVLALAASTVYGWLRWRRPWLAVAVSGLISVFIFGLAGLWSALLFAVLCALFLSLQMRNWIAGSICVVLALLAPLLAVITGRLDVPGLIIPWSKGVDWLLAATLYASVPVASVVLALLPQPPVLSRKPGTDSRPPTRWPGQVGAGSAFLLGWAVVWLAFDPRQKLLAQMDYDSSCGRYEGVLAAAKQVKGLNDPAKIRLQFALYHAGRLAEDLFSFHSLVEETPTAGIGEGCRAQSQPLFELGLINDAEHMACEALVADGERPDVLRLLARINLLKGRPQAAQVFLNVLSLIPFQGERADDGWPAMEAHRPTAGDAFQVPIRAPRLTNDVVHEGLQVGRLLDVLLASNPTNQMVFEYAMARYLLDLDLKKTVEHLRLLDNFNYARIPRPYEEAVLLYQQLARVEVDLRGRAIRPAVAGRFREFKAAVKNYKASAEDLAGMAAKFGDTYWYYYYTMLGRERAVEIQTAAP